MVWGQETGDTAFLRRLFFGHRLIQSPFQITYCLCSFPGQELKCFFICEYKKSSLEELNSPAEVTLLDLALALVALGTQHMGVEIGALGPLQLPGHMQVTKASVFLQQERLSSPFPLLEG